MNGEINVKIKNKMKYKIKMFLVPVKTRDAIYGIKIISEPRYVIQKFNNFWKIWINASEEFQFLCDAQKLCDELNTINSSDEKRMVKFKS